MAPNLIRRLSNESGAVAVEFAMVLPVISLLLFGVIQLGVTLNNYIQLANAAASGARQISISRGIATPYGSTIAAIDNAASNLTASKMTITITVNNGTTNGSCTTDTGSECQKLFPAAATAGVAPSSVTVTYPCNLTFWTIKFAGCTLSSSSTEIIQ
jgi:Flp pilus assembly protein TadG